MQKRLAVVLIACLLANVRVYGQTDTAVHELNEVVVTGLKEETRRETSLNILPIKADEMRQNGSFNIADGLAKHPGISQLNTGVAISKPVIRGLYGNRVLTLVSGLRFDNQQWQDEHGLGLSEIGIDRIEVIKGPISVIHGSDAVGGLLNVIEENPAPENKLVVDINTKFHTNTLGGTMDVGVKGNRNNKWWRVRAGAENNGDYSDGNNVRVLNSRFDAYYLKSTFGITKGKWTSVNNYHFSMNDFGFILADITDFLKPDARWSRSMKGPHHIVILNLLSSQNTCVLKNSVLKFNTGFQSNSRMENEGGGKISLNMLLSTIQYNLQWIKTIHPKIELIVSQNSSYENNTNFGGRIIIPDAHMAEVSGSAFFKFRLSKIIFETGAGLNGRYIKTILTRLVNTPDKDIAPFSRFKLSVNGLVGFTYNPTEHWNLKLGFATGYRAPNLAELSSNGLHEGTYNYEIGDPNLKNEQNLNTDLTLSYVSPWFNASASGFFNQFYNYIYLQPTGEERFGFTIFRYLQNTVYLTGGEAELEFTPQGVVKGLSIAGQFSGLYTRMASGDHLPFIPAPKLGTTLKYQHDLHEHVKAFYCSVGFDYVFNQEMPAPYETRTDAYYLLNASIGSDFIFKKGKLRLGVTGNNLLGTNYYDHLSRFKYYGIHNIGRNITVNISIPLEFNYLQTNKNKNKQ